MGLFRKSDQQEGTTLSPQRPEPTPARPARTTITAGVPGRCPACDGFGYIDHIDMVNRIQTQHCRDCAHRWEYSFDEAGEVTDVIDLTESAPARSLST